LWHDLVEILVGSGPVRRLNVEESGDDHSDGCTEQPAVSWWSDHWTHQGESKEPACKQVNASLAWDLLQLLVVEFLEL
jgi:hypothetical protein